METNTTFRSGSTETVYEAQKAPKDIKVGGESNVEVPFLDYKSEHKRPFCADFFKLGEQFVTGLYLVILSVICNCKVFYE